jgi:hypothetical protein
LVGKPAQREAFMTVGGLADYLDLRVQQFGQAFADQTLVIDDYNLH